MIFKTVCRWSPHERLYRVARFIWRRGQGPGYGWPNNYDACVSIAVGVPRFKWKRESDGWRLWIGPLRIHRKTSWGGVIV